MTRKLFALPIAGLLAILAAAPSTAAAPRPPKPDVPRALVLEGATLLDVSSFGNSSSDIKDSVIVLRGDRIVAAGPRGEVKIPAGAEILHVAGKYVVPGLNDAFATLNNQSQANAFLYMGVTSIVGLGEPEGGRRGPLFLDASPSPRIYRLDWEWSENASASEPELIRQIDALARSGVKALLLHYNLTPAQVRVIARRARELGVASIGELGATTYPEAIQAGVNAFVHSSRYSLELAPPALRKEVAEDPFGPPRVKFYEFLIQISPADPALQRYAAVLGSGRSGLIPTMSMLYLDLPDHENPWKEPIAAILDPKDIHLPADPVTGRMAQPAAGPADAVQSGRAAAMLKIEEQYRKAGAHYLAGSGSDAFGTMPGISLHTELKLLTRIGLTPRQALAAATGNVGEILGWSDVGQVKPGYHADLLVLDENPVQEIGNLKKIRMVILNGKVLDRDRFLVKSSRP
jgi:hypothetical protein